MSKGITARLAGTFVLFLVLSADSLSQDAVSGSIRLMFYNAENLFDIDNDPVTEDDEFTPEGIRRWTRSRYIRKLNSVAKVIIASGDWEPPALIGLCEIENRKVLEDLVNNTNLSRYDLGIIHKESPDPRGIDVCLIYLKNLISVDTSLFFKLKSTGEEEFNTRSILYARCCVMKDTINLFVNHWPSRRGGVLASESQRVSIAERLKFTIDSIAEVHGKDEKYIIVGDFNASPADDVIKLITGRYASGVSMVNLSEMINTGEGTYRYQGSWEIIDQVIVSSGLLEEGSGLFVRPGSLKIMENEFLLADDPVYPGRSPFSTWRGYSYQAGFSDHLPVILDMIFGRIIYKE